MSIREKIRYAGVVFYVFVLVVTILGVGAAYALSWVHPLWFSEYIRRPGSGLEARMIDGVWSAMTPEKLSQIPDVIHYVPVDKRNYIYVGRYKAFMHEYTLEVIADSPSFHSRTKEAYISNSKIRPFSVFKPLLIGVVIVIGGWFVLPTSQRKYLMGNKNAIKNQDK